MLVCMALGALLANGATGPLAALTALLLPPEFKSFALSVYEFLTGLLGPMYSVIIGVGLQVGALHCCLYSFKRFIRRFRASLESQYDKPWIFTNSKTEIKTEGTVDTCFGGMAFIRVCFHWGLA